MVNNKYIKKAEEELEYLSGDEETRRLAELREKAIRDELAAIAQAKDEGLSEGFSQGFNKGISDGISKGISKEKIKVAKKMLDQNIDIETISEITELTEEEIENIKNSKDNV